MPFPDLVRNVGAVAGLVAVTWNFLTLIRSYLTLEVALRQERPSLWLLTVTLQNAATWSKRIHYAVVVVAPESMGLNQVVSAIAGTGPEPGGSRAFERLYALAPQDRIARPDCVVVPLHEIYRDQARIGPTEKISHAVSIPTATLVGDGVQVVRVIVYISYFGLLLRWRYTSCAFMLEGASDASIA